MKFDDASWHYGGDFPEDLPDEAGATHIAMFVMWAWINGLAGDLHVNAYPEDVQLALARETSPALIFLRVCDGKFTDEDLSAEGNEFAQAYYANEERTVVGYLEDYENLFHDLPSTYHVPDTWESFEKVAPLIASRFDEWRSGKRWDRGSST